MIDLFEETRALLTELSRAGVEYAVAGAVALAVHGVPRATTDIDLLTPPDQVDPILAIARTLGFDLEAMPMRFSDGMEVRRVSKVDGEETLTLDLLLVNQNLLPVWEDRLELDTDFGPIWVVSRAGLIRMKIWAGRNQDLADIRRLEDMDR